jgi:cell wall-associated NlpC family hydrolase
MSRVAPPHLTSHRNDSAFASATLWVSALSAVFALFQSSVAAAVESEAAQNNASASPIKRIEKNLRDMGGKAIDGAAEISSLALSLIGVDYKFGGNTPEQGLDCSGFVRYVFQHATGISLPRTSREQATVGKSIERDELQPGDLVFFNTRRLQFSHVGVYLGENRFVHSPSKGGAVEVVEMDNSYWKKVFNGARRVIGGDHHQGAKVVATKRGKNNVRSASGGTSTVALNAPTEAVATTTSAAAPTHLDINSLPMATTYPITAADK